MVPILNYEITPYNETEWCMDQYQATNCTEVRDKAQGEVEDLMLTFYHANLAWGIVLILVVSLSF